MGNAELVSTKSLKELKTFEERLDDEDKIKVALAEMAVHRGTFAPEHYLNVFSRRLAKEYLPGILAALEKISDMEPREGETLLPSIGKILNNRPVRDTWES